MIPDDRNKLSKIAGLLASSSAGERASAAARASEILAKNDLTWQDVIAYLPAKEPVEVTADLLFDDDDMEDLQSVVAGEDPLQNDFIFKASGS